MPTIFGIKLDAYHPSHHDWVLSIPAKKPYVCTCLRCQQYKAIKRLNPKAKIHQNKSSWAKNILFKTHK